ncbi:MbcA/ParS/Xre antitoxin family protein [Reinekea sp. G2M2-21]|uniref:MbcA/ParS/Xre antitoxin family protein n=1 Tax=Reinekea sp. G2M2-21 TaxID=2788942 RepID=UPI0018A95E34|nr:MbcA/ParS/Xre antitoxin family protein [Reinekea sp. G2M2-21]
MKHHFSLTFKVAERQAVDVDEVASQLSGSDFHVEPGPLSGTEFSVHFEREGDHAADLLSYAREQVLNAVPNAELVSMDMSEEPPMNGAVDDITKLVIRACQVFEDPELAHAWLNRPQELLNGTVPKLLMASAEGRTRVSRVLTTLESKKE